MKLSYNAIHYGLRSAPVIPIVQFNDVHEALDIAAKT